MKFHTQAVAAALLSTTLSKVLASDSCDTRGDYGCGTGQGVQPWWTEDCQPYDCCCDTFGVHTPDTACANFQNAPKGCSSCIGKDSCKDVSPGSVLVGDNSCHGAESCREATHNPMALTSTVFWQNSCTGVQSCKQVSQVIIGSGSCDNLRSCYRMRETTVGENSCGGSNACEYLFSSTVGDNSCQGGIEGLDLSICAGWEGNTKYGAHLKIGNRACNGYVGADTGEYGVCTYCENNTEVPDDSCNDITGNDVVYLDHWGYTCVYCVSEPTSTTVSAQYVTTNTNRRRLTDASPEDELKADCMVLAGQLLSYLHVSIVEYPAFRNLVSDDESVCDGKYKNVHQVQADPATGTCTVQLTQHWMMRGLMSTDIPAVDYIAEQIQSYDFSDSGTTHFFTQSYLDASQTGIECKDKGGKSGKASSNSSKGSKTKEEGTDLD